MKTSTFRMQKYSLNEYFLLPNPGIPRYFGHVIHGNPSVYRSTFYGTKEASTVLFDWNKRLGTIGSTYPQLLEFEMDLAKKVGPLSYMQPLDKRLESVGNYFTMSQLNGDPVSDEAILAATSEWGDAFDHALSQRERNDVLQNVPLSTNSGCPYFTRRKLVPYTNFDIWLDDCEVVYRDSRWSGKLAAILGWRGQEGGPTVNDVKQRVVWMYPFALNIAEAEVYQPAIELFQKSGKVPAWIGNNAVDAAITRLFDTKADEDLIVCTDFSAFDQHFGKPMQNAALKCLHYLMTPTQSSMEWQDNIFPIKYNIPILLDTNRMMVGHHGMASGSSGTNFDETLAHRCLQHEAALASGQQLNFNSMCLGDDGILSYPGITVDKVVDVYTKHGLEMNLSKQYASTSDCVYLRRWHSKYYRPDGLSRGVYSTCRALGRLMYQERFINPKIWGPKAIALRQLSILENVEYHPLREEFAEFCMRGDKYRLGLDIPGFITNIQSEADKYTELMPDFIGYNNSQMSEGKSIDEWWIVQYLRNKR